MIANLLRAAVLLTVLAAVAAVILGVQQGRPAAGIGWALAILGAVAPILAAELALMHVQNLRTRGLLPGHEQHVEAPPQARAAQLVAAWWGEVITFAAVFAWRQPFRANAVPDVPAGTQPLPGAGAHARRGVVLVHGYCCNRGLWNPWLAQLRARGVPTIAVDLEPVFGSIDDYPPCVEMAVRRLVEATGERPVLVGHSMGGLALRAWLRHGGPAAIERVHHVVTIGTPHHGTWLAKAAHTPNGRQMRLHSPWLRDLAAAAPGDQARHFTCFWSHCDNIVFPASSATLPGADNRHLEATAHVDLVNRREVFAEVLRRVTEPARMTAATPEHLHP